MILVGKQNQHENQEYHIAAKRMALVFSRAILSLTKEPIEPDSARIRNVVKLARLLKIMSTVDYVSADDGEKTAWTGVDMERVAEIIGLALEGKEVSPIDLTWANRYIQHCNIHLGKLAGPAPVASKKEEDEVTAPVPSRQKQRPRSRRTGNL